MIALVGVVSMFVLGGAARNADAVVRASLLAATEISAVRLLPIPDAVSRLRTQSGDGKLRVALDAAPDAGPGLPCLPFRRGVRPDPQN